MNYLLYSANGQIIKEEDNFGNEMEIKRPNDEYSAKKNFYSVRD